MKHYHPQKNDEGKLVELHIPNQPTPLSNWLAADLLASVVPAGPMPDAIGGIPVQSWTDAPSSVADWERMAASTAFDEPMFKVKPGKNPASGVVTLEEDGRVWAVSPSNRYGGYTSTFPKGTISPVDNISLRANALKEAYEESGLKVELTGFLADSDRSMTTTRYYLARRVGGNPADMGWESQAVHLVPLSQLSKLVSHKNDANVLTALQEKLSLFVSSSGRTVRREDSLVSLRTLSEVSAQFSIKGNFSDSDMARIRRGFRPTSDDDKWFIFCESDRCYFHRASNGFLFFVVDFVREDVVSGRPWVVDKCMVGLGALQDLIPSEPLLLHLIDYHLLGKS